MRGFLLLSAALLLTLYACKQAPCFTVYDGCRDDPSVDAALPPKPDAALIRMDGGVDKDAGFLGCVKMECQMQCAGVVDFRYVCLNPPCVACQSANDPQGAVFCGRLFSCGRDAAVDIPDAAVVTTDAATNTDGSISDSGIHPG